MKSVQRLDFLTYGDPAPSEKRDLARRYLARFRSSEIHDPENRRFTASHEAGHAFISILSGERILDVWVSEFSSRVNHALGIYGGYVSQSETSVFMGLKDEDAFNPRDFEGVSAREVLLDAINSITGLLHEHVLDPEKLSLERIKVNALASIYAEEDDFSLFQESFLVFLQKKYANFSELPFGSREFVYKKALDLFLAAMIDFIAQPYIQKVLEGIARKFLKESRMRGPQVKGQILQALREEGIFAEDFDLIRADLSQRLTVFEAALEKKLANLLESP